VLRRLFPWRTTLVLLLAVGGMAGLFQAVYARELNEPMSYVQAVYAILNMIFFQLAYTDVPSDLQLAPFFVLVPIIGLSLFSLLGINVFRVLRVFFVRHERGQQWQEALAATYRDHVVVCGLGSIGYRVALQLAELGQPVVGIELTRTELVQDLIDADVPVIVGNIRGRDVLTKTGVARATSAIVCTNQDIANLEAAFHVRELNPEARLVVRIFDDEIARLVESKGEMAAVLSRSAIAAVAFAHAAVGIEVLETFQLGDVAYVLARVPLRAGSPLVGSTIDDVARAHDVTIAFLCREQRLVNEPPRDTRLESGDDLFLFAASEQLTALAHFNVPDDGAVTGRSEHIVVCGLGHVGYRTVNILLALGYPVTALHLAPHYLSERLAEQGARVEIADFRRRNVLAEAGVAQAKCIVVCSDDDVLNLETGLRARELKPDIRIVMRIFEEELGRRLSETFGFDVVYSTSVLAVPAFVGAALGLHLAQETIIGGERWFLTRLAVGPRSDLNGCTVQELNDAEQLTVVLHARCDRLDIPPHARTPIQVGDELVVLVSPVQLRRLSQLNRSVTPARGRWL